MSNKSAHPDRDFSRFDAMSTEELNAIVYQDAMLPPEQETDTDAILYIMEVIAKREAMEHPEDTPSTEEAWARFNALYRTENGDGSSLYEDDDENAMPILSAVPSQPPTEYKRPRKNIRFAIRTAIVAAVLCVLLLGSSLIASSSCFDFWETLVEWGRETFGFNSAAIPMERDSLYTESNDPRDVLLKHDISVPLIPTWMPEGYEFQEIEFMETPMRTVFYVKYTNGNQWIGMSIALLSSTPAQAYEKDDDNTIIYYKNEIDHYIVKNLEEITVAWAVGSYECSIRGPISVEEAQNIIDSIYRS